MKLAVPLRDASEAQRHCGMLVVIMARDPRIRTPDVDSKLFVQLARKRLRGCFPRFDFSTREFPIAGVRLAGGALREQERAVLSLQHRCGDFNALAVEHRLCERT